MADDLEAFLRQAAQRRAARKKPAQPRPAQPQPQPPSAQQPQRQQPLRRALASEPEVVEALVIPDELRRLETHVDTSKFDRRAEHMGEEVGHADEDLEARLHRKFDHRLGALDDGPGMPAPDLPTEETASTASEIAQLLGDPQSVRLAIILSEVLSPPHHRW